MTKLPFIIVTLASGASCPMKLEVEDDSSGVGLDATEAAGDEETLSDSDEALALDADAQEFDADDEEEEDEDDDYDIDDEDGDPIVIEGDDGTMPPVTDRRMSNASTVDWVSLRSAIGGAGKGKPTVDRAGNAIRNVAVMQAGPAKGHGFAIDKTMLSQVAKQMGDGVAMRFTHPDRRGADGIMQETDPLGTHVGKVTNVKLSVAGDEVRGDIEFGPHAKNVPLYGDVQSYLLDLAENDPSAFGLSTVYKPAPYDRDPVSGTPLGRSEYVAACDLTGDPASNRRGLI